MFSVMCLRLMASISSRFVYNSLLDWALWKLGKCEDQTWYLENSDKGCGMERSHKHNTLSIILSLSQVQVKLIQDYTGPEDKNDRKEESTVWPEVITSGNRKVNKCYCHSRLLGKLKHVINIDRETDCGCGLVFVFISSDCIAPAVTLSRPT